MVTGDGAKNAKNDSNVSIPAVAGYFSSQSILSLLPAKISQQLINSSRRVQLLSGQILFEKGDAGDGCYWLETGVLKVSVASSQGEQRILAVLGPGAIVGELAMVDGLSRSATVEAIEDCKLIFISRAAFVGLLKENPHTYEYLLSILVSRLRQADEEFAAAAFLSVKSRVARALLQFANHLGVDLGSNQIQIRHRIRQNDLAAMAGVARESVSRELSAWKRRNVIRRLTRSTYIINQKVLAREAKGGPTND